MKIRRLKDYLKDYGFHGTVATLKDKVLRSPQEEVPYSKWLIRTRCSSRDYSRMAKTEFRRKPDIGVLAHAEGRDRTAFMESLSLQIYRSFHAARAGRRAEIISDYLLFAGPGCSLAPDLLWQCVKLINESDNIDLIYFDSDRIGEDGRKEDPCFRPDYDPELLAAVNYIGNVFLVRAGVAVQAGLPPAQWQGDEYHDFLRRIALLEENKGPGVRERIRHIPRVLFHEDHKLYLEDMEKDYQPRRPSARESEISADSPLLSVIIPNMDHWGDLENCVRSLRENNTVQNMEILILENNSRDPETFKLYRRLEAEDERIHVLRWERPFNYSAINNYGAANASGSYLLFLNNDTEILRKDSLHILLDIVSSQKVGAAGALLLYPDMRIQHGGVILGYGGIAGHAFQGEELDMGLGTFPQLLVRNIRNVSAVTGACMMMRRELFLKMGGFDEELAVTFNDIDLCLRLREAGYRVLQVPDAQLVHYESLSRGAEDSEEKVARFHSEIRHFVEKWEKELENGDPFYNKNLTLNGRTFTCADTYREARPPYLKYLHLDE